MARFRKEVIGSGGYATPDGAQVVSPARLQHWADTINEMVRVGIKPPLSWGHSKQAVPHADDAEFWRSRLAAGKLAGADITPKGRLAVRGDGPGIEQDADGQMYALVDHPDGYKVRARIEEVSIGAMDWTDGTGRVWRDAPVHVALTPLPVWVPEGGQPPFEPVEDGSKVARFSTASLLYRFASSEGDMADDDKKDDKPFDGDGDDAVPEVGLSEVLEALASINLHLPESTTEATLMRDIVVAAAALAGASGAADATEEPVTTADDDGMTSGGGAFMSTLRDDPIGKGLIARLEADDREKRLTRIKALQSRGLSHVQAAKLREQATAVRFSTNASGEPLRAGVDDVLEALEASLPAATESTTASLYTHLAGFSTAAPPEGDEETQRKRDQAVADELARNAGLPARVRA